MPKKPAPKKSPIISTALLGDVRSLSLSAREGVARAVNAGLTLLYWEIGNRIRHDILQKKREDYGQEILPTLSAKLAQEFGHGFDEKNLRRMVQLAELFPDREIVAALLRQLGWTHFTLLLPIKDPFKRDFHAEMCRIERWSTRTLEKKIGGMLFERTALSKKPAKLAEQELQKLRAEDQLTPDLIFRDPYFLDFLGLLESHAEPKRTHKTKTVISTGAQAERRAERSGETSHFAFRERAARIIARFHLPPPARRKVRGFSTPPFSSSYSRQTGLLFFSRSPDGWLSRLPPVTSRCRRSTSNTDQGSFLPRAV